MPATASPLTLRATPTSRAARLDQLPPRQPGSGHSGERHRRCWANERFPWLICPLLPLLLLAGLGVQAIWDARGGRPAASGSRPWPPAPPISASRRGRRTSRTAPIRASSWCRRSRRSRYWACATRCWRSRRTPSGEGRDLRVLVDSAQGADVPVGVVLPRPRRGLPRPHGGGDALRHRRGDPDRGRPQRRRGELAGYEGRRFPFRVWWVRDYGAMSPGGWWRWFTRREPWNETGGLPEWLYVRQGAEVSGP